MSDRNSSPPFERQGTTPRTPTFDRDYNPTPNEELETRLPILPFWKIREQSMEFGRLCVYRPSQEKLTKKVNDAVEKFIAVKPSKTKLKLKVNRITLTASWKWRNSKDDDACGICRGAFEACCTNCKLPGDGCPLALGECNHSFHLHCISKWIDSQPNPSCPLCRTEWKLIPSFPCRRSRSPGARRSSASPPHSHSRTPTPNPSSNNSIIISPPQLSYPTYDPGSPILNPSSNNSSSISPPQLYYPTYSPHSPIYHPMEDRSPSARRSSASPPHSHNRTPTPNPSNNNNNIISSPQLNHPTYDPGSMPHLPVSISYSPHSPIYHPMEEQ
uniref:Anaphase-promoting complex subunit 11 n=1 Tax=Panagrolaimus sp. PS1159 TaxID=55785 RepID=A0AC35FZ26_9BILA